MKIVFTSCMDAERDPVQPVWNRIAAEKPDVLMLLGDQIYMDWGDLNEPKWLADLRRELPGNTRTLELFATAMYQRYAAQWAVESFRNLLAALPGRTAERLLVVWDDHDFAWNNSVGFDNPALPDAYKHGVPSKVKQVSRRLAVQFIDQLRNGVTSDARYPEMPIDLLSAVDVARGLSWRGQLGGSGPECLLLDGRWARTVRSGDPAFGEPRSLEEAQSDALKVEPRTLEVDQRRALRAEVARDGAGLLIVASGVPLVHDYLMSQQDWRGRPKGSASGASDKEPPYEEYEEITAAKRPVLYLAGDIHRNSWGGRVPTPEPPARPSRVLQLVSSGAAIQVDVGPKIRGAYGMVKLEGDEAAFFSGRMSVSLKMDDDRGNPVEFPRMGPEIRWNADDWQGELLGEAWDDVEAPLDTRPLLALSSRPWRKGHPVADHVSVTSTWEMDSWWSREVIRTPDSIMGADPRAAVPIDGLTLDARGTGARVLIDRGLRSHPDQLNTQLRAAYERARARTAPLVFYIHGVGKSTHQAIRQASALRWLYGCEPVLWAWEAGNPVGLWTSIKALHDVGDSAVTGAPALAQALNALCALAPGFRERGVETIVLARSAGTMALCEALRWKGANFGGHGMAGVSRVVLSAGLLEWRKFEARDAFGHLDTPTVVTCNAHDRTLGAAKFGTPLLSEIGRAAQYPGGLGGSVSLKILDFSHAARVGRLHDYLFVPASDAVRAVNQALLGKGPFDPSAWVKLGVLADSGNGIYRVA